MDDFSSFLEQVGQFEDDLNGIKSGSSSLSGTIESGKNTINKGQQLVNSAGVFISDPKQLLRSIVYLGIEKGEQKAKTWLLGCISNGMFQVYLDESFAKHRAMSADEYLIHYGVKDGINGLNFKNSSFLSDDQYRMIDLVWNTISKCTSLSFFGRIRRSTSFRDVRSRPGWTETA